MLADLLRARHAGSFTSRHGFVEVQNFYPVLPEAGLDFPRLIQGNCIQTNAQFLAPRHQGSDRVVGLAKGNSP